MTFRDRERIKRKVARWRAKFAALPAIERAAILEALASVPPPSSEVTMISPTAVQKPPEHCPSMVPLPVPDLPDCLRRAPSSPPVQRAPAK